MSCGQYFPLGLDQEQFDEGYKQLDWIANFFNEDDLNIASGELMQAKSFLDSNKYLDTDSMEPDEITDFIKKKKDAEDILFTDQTKRMGRLNGMMKKIVNYLDSTERIAIALEDIGKNTKMLTEAIALGPALVDMETAQQDLAAIQKSVPEAKKKRKLRECEDNNNSQHNSYTADSCCSKVQRE